MASPFFGDWEEAIKRLNGMAALMDQNLSIATETNAVHMREATKQTIMDQPSEWAPLQPATIARKGSSKMLIDKGDLKDSINYQMVTQHEAFVGVPRNAVQRDSDEPLVNIAAVHEFGSPKQHIPKRSFIYRTFHEIYEKLVKRYRDAAAATMRGKVYRPNLVIGGGK